MTDLILADVVKGGSGPVFIRMIRVRLLGG